MLAEYLVRVVSYFRDDVIQSQFPVTVQLSPLGLPWSNLVTFFSILLFFSLIHLIFLRQSRFYLFSSSSDHSIKNWFDPLLTAFQKPFYLFIWTFAVSCSLLSITVGHEPMQKLSHGVDLILSLMTSVSFFWFCFNLVNLGARQFNLRVVESASPFGKTIYSIAMDGVRGVLVILSFYLSIQIVEIPDSLATFLSRSGSILLIVVIAWFLIRLTLALDSIILAQFQIYEKDNLRARKIYTQIHVIQKMLIFFISAIALAAILMLFDGARKFGTTILASAGLAGVVLGLAAQHTISNLLAGLQIALTQPIRLDDVVVVEGEWGRVEEIALTYVVVKVWDLRRLVVPINYFLNKPFQNWTRSGSDIMGTVFFYADYSIPIPALRNAAQEAVQDSAYWDGKMCNLQVTQLSERSIELRIVLSAENSSNLWNLRCEMREKLLGFVQEYYPQSFPAVKGSSSQSVPQGMPQTVQLI
jgi:small-conductance mechanosensitive channel